MVLKQFVDEKGRCGPLRGSVYEGGRVTKLNSTVVCQGECVCGPLETAKLETF